ncbi:TetR/AcrR family transcriptional regulator [Oscillochloris sp. ZM17-4]|uniref:TetR/AcrR family transcriptional regulator n=1 Tax=Oscillochloris sp. ZM17-4 TaxID=2866714 RepID=UPI001C72DA0E|nr:TetR/AcrR family transcriptional regulator [Oscillochloris sp. ZM17-4]MBX0327648.1 TetR/AcrR family transcriptional regulator [Oscillochloris sp. ZM17-4]
MPPRDEQDYEERRQQIIDGALEAFAAKGFDGASNKDIAEAAKIGSPGLIYHYFKDKVDLLHQVVLQRMALIKIMDSAETMLDQPPEQALPELADKLLEALTLWPTLAIARVVLAESIRNKRVAHMVSEIGPGRGLGILATYLERQMDAGKIRRMNPQIAARMLVGPILAYALTNYIFEQPEIQDVSPREMADQTIQGFLRAMAIDA